MANISTLHVESVFDLQVFATFQGGDMHIGMHSLFLRFLAATVTAKHRDSYTAKTQIREYLDTI